MIKLLKKASRIGNLALIFLLIVALLSKYLSPSLFIPINLIGMTYPFLVVLLFLYIIINLFFKQWNWFFINIGVLLLGWIQLTSWIQWNKTSELRADFKILSYNVRLFDLYDWKNNIENRNKMLKFIDEQKADIVSFQEFYYDNKDVLVDSISQKLNMPYYYITDSKFLYGSSHFGQAIFSKFPIIKSDLIQYPNTTNMSMFCDIKINDKGIVRIFSNHLESYRFSKADYELAENVTDTFDLEVNKYLSIYNRMKKAMIKRSYQADKLSSYIKSSPYPVIVTGDFNDTPNSYTYYIIRGDLNDAFIESGNGVSNTYKGAFPAFRIDFILHSKEIKSQNYKRLIYNGSDHYPISCEIILN
ncbi:MAG: endonuclease/exonuclease/phosphatase family protein [Bacteroidales bacterium]|nr:endonuclease/exonuclease/phosphatase family protein [Bacteroidales bacterium]